MSCSTIKSYGATEHDCSKYLISKYDKTNHWDQCSVCGTKYNKTAHDYEEYWTMGDSCSNNNKLVHQCKGCGYSYKTSNTREHTWNKDYAKNAESHHTVCTLCGAEKGDLDVHRDADGNQLTCQNPGKCATCGYEVYRHRYFTNYNTKSKKWRNNDTVVKCSMCGDVLFYTSNVNVDYQLLGSQFTLHIDIPLEHSLGDRIQNKSSKCWNYVLSQYNYSITITDTNLILDATGTYNGCNWYL